ncbi:MAG: hypothetical protein NXI18_01465 [Alphaproteobacteria bacterium]|nr:hypothetical protein [Alphaproteobacteria bacterium]
MRFLPMTGIAPLLLAILLLMPAPAQALSPVPFFQGVERLAVFCGRPTATDLRTALCTLAESALEDLSGSDVAVGTAALSDPNAVTVLVNGYEIAGPNGPLLVIDVRMLRPGHVDARLFGSAPIVVGTDAPLTESSELADSLAALLFDTVVDPWRRAVPATGQAPVEKKG